MVPALLLATSAHAASIYSCDQAGHKVFSQQPCGADAKVVSSGAAERTVTLSEDMSAGDIGYLCGLAMRSWEMAEEDRRNSIRSGYYPRGSGADDPAERRQTFVLSHIDNLERVAVDDPELYDAAKSIARRSFSGRSGSYLYDAERARAQETCERDLRASIERVKSRHDAEDDCRYRQPHCRY
jgi:hypothetical protein